MRCDDLSDDVGCRISAFERIGVMCQPLFFVGFLVGLLWDEALFFARGLGLDSLKFRVSKLCDSNTLVCGAADIF